MAGITLEQAEARLTQYMDAEAKVLASQSYEMAGRRLTRANLQEIRDGIVHWNGMVQQLSQRVTGRGRARTVIAAG